MSKLTALGVKKAGPGRHGDGSGLYLMVSNSGSRKWVLRIQSNGKRRDLGLGSGTKVSLSEAREAAEDMRRAIRRGEDPVAEKRRARATMPTFREAAVMVHQEHRTSWKNPKHAQQWLTTLETYVFPHLGDLPINQIDGPMVRDVLAEIWLNIPETARRVRQRIGTVLDVAHAKGWREAEAPMRSVSRGLPKQPKIKGHFAAMPWQQVPGFIADMTSILKATESVLLATEFLILTAARSGEVRGATWSEFDLDDRVWLVPAKRMKGGRAHRVPLSGRAMDILDRMGTFRCTTGSKAYVFEGQKPGRPLSDMALMMPIRRAELPITVHGFRSAFRDWCAEATNTPREVAEACLAHVVRNAVEAAYARTDHLVRRREVMDSWAEFLATNPNRRGNVTPIRMAVD
ncbi:MAG: integrase arm-type DNA-binding domain-containing protein [Alphaproteobacteria bacterium]|nr:integrase [Rhodospirillaceae bacterium]MDP6023519.1 integrase arm-type DNA-binding domain-containing protein [Alphaproteobacteria bacterium]HJM90901.1 integrase arm-type DNA-binding domain-containing protein [Alphaproteobacteria bacterium]